MSVMTIVVAKINDVAGFAEAGSSWGKQKLMDMGCLDATASRIVHGGELAGMTTIAFEGESADASIAGSDAINADSQIVQMMGDTGVSVLRRTLFGVTGERGDRSGDYISGVYVTGPPTADGLDIGWPLVQDHVNGTMILSVIAGGPAPWTGTVVTTADSADAIIEGGVKSWSDPKMQEFMANNGSQAIGRILGKRLF